MLKKNIVNDSNIVLMKWNDLLPSGHLKSANRRRWFPIFQKFRHLAYFLAVWLFIFPLVVSAQIWEPEGLNMPGGWNSWTNPPTNKYALASFTQVIGGRVTKITGDITRWQTIFSVAATGADLVGGSYPFLFTSGPSGSPWNNSWKNVTVSMNVLQTYTFQGSTDDQITIVNGKWYTMNWKDNGYANTQAVFMETSAQPVSISSVTAPVQSSPNSPITVIVSTSAIPCPEEIIYLRYSTDLWLTSTAVAFAMTGSTGTAIIPGQATGKTISCYAFTSTLSGINADFDMKSIHINNNGGTNYQISIGNSAPVVSTGVITDISGTTATAGGIVLSDGGTSVTARGICWGNSLNPSLSNNFSTSGTGTGSFTASLSNLIPGTTYHVRAYATNASGTSYGSDVQFTCLSSVTFQLDMSTCSGFVPASDQVYISGNYTSAGWNEPGTNAGLLLVPTQAGSLNYVLTLYIANGTYEFKYFKNTGWNGGEWTGTVNRSMTINGNATVNNTWGGEISYANLQWPSSGSIISGDPFSVYARVTIPNGRTGVTGGAYGVHAWIGFNSGPTDPSGWTNWIPATYNNASGSSDEYKADLGAAILTPGVYYYASRFQAGSGPYSYGGYNGGLWNGTTNVSGTLTVIPSTGTRTLIVKVFLEGLYSGGSLMKKAQNASGDQFSGAIADKVTLELHSQSNYSQIVFSAENLDLATDGTIQISNIPNTLNGSYYITIRHRNSITTSSNSAVSLAVSSVTYDFTGSASQAYGSNLKSIGGKYCIFSGDVNMDGVVNGLDKSIVATNVALFSEGYLASDLNGDGLTDTSDQIIIDNNSRLQATSVLP